MEQHQFRIFSVDDDPFHLSMMEELLKAEGYTALHRFSNGLEALDEMWRKPDVVFLDHCMDAYSGYEVLKKMKRFDPNVFVVIVSAQEEVKVAVATLKHGAFDYICKDAALGDSVRAVLGSIAKVKALLKARKPSLLENLLKRR